MSDITRTGGCLCGQLRYEARGEPNFAGHCYCADCRKASGSGFIPFMGFPASERLCEREQGAHQDQLGHQGELPRRVLPSDRAQLQR